MDMSSVEPHLTTPRSFASLTHHVGMSHGLANWGSGRPNKRRTMDCPFHISCQYPELYSDIQSNLNPSFYGVPEKLSKWTYMRIFLFRIEPRISTLLSIAYPFGCMMHEWVMLWSCGECDIKGWMMILSSYSVIFILYYSVFEWLR